MSEFVKKTFVIRSVDVILRLTEFLKAQSKEPLLEVVVKKHHHDRSIIQNSLYWLWNTVIAEELGMLKEEVHEDLKRRMLVPIYERDDEGYAAMIHAVRKVHTQGFKEDAKALFDQIVKLTSTTNAKVKQFTEYLNEIERDMIGKGIVLPHPEDRYYTAMGTHSHS